MAMSRGYADLRNHGADDGCSRRGPDGYALLGRAWGSAERNGPDVLADERLSFGALAEADLPPAKRRLGIPPHLSLLPFDTPALSLSRDDQRRDDHGNQHSIPAESRAPSKRQIKAGSVVHFASAIYTTIAAFPKRTSTLSEA